MNKELICLYTWILKEGFHVCSIKGWPKNVKEHWIDGGYYVTLRKDGEKGYHTTLSVWLTPNEIS